MKFDPTYDGPVQGFQLWINLKSANKLDPPEFQNARADAMPLVDVAPGVRAKVLLGALNGQASPVETQGIRCCYCDYELESGAEATHPRATGMSTLFVYVYEGSGTFCGTSAKKGEVLRLSSSGDVRQSVVQIGLHAPRWKPFRSPSSSTARSSCRRKTRSCRPSRTTTRATSSRRSAHTSSTRRAGP